MQAVDPNLRQKRSRQHDPKCRLQSSQYTLIIPHRVIQLTTKVLYHSGPRDRVAPPTSQQIGQFPPKRVKYRHRHPFFFFFFPHPQESSLCSQPIRDKVRWTGRVFTEHVERRFLDPEHSFVAVRQSEAKVRPIKNYVRRTFSGCCWSLLYSAILRSRRDSTSVTSFFIARFCISTEVVYLQRWHGWCHLKLLPSRRILWTPFNHAPCHFVQIHIRRMKACLVVTCHLHLWQNDRDLLRAAAVTRGWNGHRNESAQKVDPWEEIIPQLLPGLEPETFRSRVRRSDQ